MSKKMLIDATHTEEVRVAVVDQGRLDEFDYESAVRKPLKGNIYLAKVTRVEPSLQAAFVNFGGNRHGFLPFSEIHPDYFRIPVADREALIAEQEEALKEHDEKAESEEDDAEDATDQVDDDADDEDEVEELGGDLAIEKGDKHSGEDAPQEDEEKADKKPKRGRKSKKDKEADEAKEDKKPSKAKSKKAAEKSEDDTDGDDNIGNRIDDEDEDIDDNIGNRAEDENADADGNNQNRGGRGRGRGRGGRGRGGRNNRGGRGRGRGNAAHKSKRVETFGGDEMDGEQKFRFNLRRKYKIQEVIKRGQIMLVQVSKEERGNKGAAVGSYLSLPGRYCVLMPNSPRAGGVSRKISNYKDRAKMRDMMKELEVPKGMSVILRTAGVTRTKAEVKRDLDYLLRLWNTIRETTLESSAPALVYEEADLIKRAVRDLYTRDVEEIHVAGETGYKTAKEFMKMMIPSHVKKVKEYKEDKPLFNKFQIEGQIADIGETTVTLKSGGYLVINPTEALVSIDVNSGKATKERHIEETALKTNLEAAEEVARQLRLRDLGGLVVIDFIDMEDRRNNGKVERKMRDALSTDRARIQMGRISSFGLMEMSRQRLSPSLTESQFETCPHCLGAGRIRTADAASIMVLRAIEAEGIKNRAAQLIAHVPDAVALYILNKKRDALADIEARYNFTVLIRVDDSMGASGFRVEVSKPIGKGGAKSDDADEDVDPATQFDNRKDGESDEDGEKSGNRRGGRRRGRRGGRGRGGRNKNEDQNNHDNASEESKEKDSKADDQKADDKAEKADDKKPSRGRKKKDDDVKDEKPKKAAKPSEKKAEEKKAEEKTEAKKDDSKKEPAKKAAKPSNDDKKPAPKKAAAKKPKDEAPKEYEVVNEAPKTKKKGWWNLGS